MRRPVVIGTGTLADAGGGITRVARLTIRALQEAGEDLRIVSLHDSGPLEIAGVRVQTCGGSKLAFGARIAALALKADAIVYDSVGLSRVDPSLLPGRRASITWMHGVEVWEAIPAKYARALRRMDVVLANSSYTLARHEALHGTLATARVCHLATEEDDGPARRADFCGRPTVLIVGRIDAREGLKGHGALLDAWPRVVAGVPGARLMIVGGGSGIDAVRAAAKEQGPSGSIEVAGFVPAPDLPRYLEAAHIFAMPSRQEGFGIAYVEAMRFGLPIVASRQDAGQEVNVDGVTGYNVDLDRPQALASSLIELLSDRSRLRAFGDASAARWHQHFRYSAFRRRLTAIWADARAIAAARPGSPAKPLGGEA